MILVVAKNNRLIPVVVSAENPGAVAQIARPLSREARIAVIGSLPKRSVAHALWRAYSKQEQASEKSSSSGEKARFIREKLFAGLNDDKKVKNDFGIEELSDAYEIGMVILGKKPVYYPYNNRSVNTQEIARLTGLSHLKVTGLLYNEEMVRDILANDPHYGCIDKQLTLQDIEAILSRFFSLKPYGKGEGEGKLAGRLLGYSQNTPGNVHIAFWLDEMYDKCIYSLSVDEITPDVEAFVAKILQDLREVAGLVSETGPIIAESGGVIVAKTSLAGKVASKQWDRYEIEGVKPLEGVKERVVVVGDAHAELDGFREIIEATGLIKKGADENGADDEWIAENTIFIQGGDLIDRGPKSMEAFRYARELQIKAAVKGCRMIRIIGNHELLHLVRYGQGKWETVVNHLKDYGIIGGFDEQLWKNSQELVRLLREDIEKGLLVAAHQMGGKVITHGVVTPEFFKLLRAEHPGIESPDIFVDTVNRIFKNSVGENNFDNIIFDLKVAIQGATDSLFYAYFLYLTAQQVDELPFDEVVFHDPRQFYRNQEIAVMKGVSTERSVLNGDVGMVSNYGAGRAAIVFEDNRVFGYIHEQHIAKMPETVTYIHNGIILLGKGQSSQAKIQFLKYVWLIAGRYVYKVWVDDNRVCLQAHEDANGDTRSDRFTFDFDRLFSIGSSSDDDCSMPNDSSLSPNHCSMKVKKGDKGDYMLEIEDHSGNHGTYVDTSSERNEPKGTAGLSKTSSAGVSAFAVPLTLRTYSVNRAEHIISEAA